MKRILLGIIAVLLSLSVSAQIGIIHFEKIDENDTMQAGACTKENAERMKPLVEQYAELLKVSFSEQDKKDLAQMEAARKDMNEAAVATAVDAKTQEFVDAIKKQIAQTEKEPASAFATQAKLRSMTPEEFKARRLESLNKMLESTLQTSGQAIRQLTPAMRSSEERYMMLKQKEMMDVTVKQEMYNLKRQMAKYMVDGKLHDYDAVRDFRHGRAAVAKREKTQHGSQLVWGFVDEQMRLVIPRRYALAFDFNNYKNYRSQGVFEEFYDRDTRPWTTVGSAESGGAMMGMIDKDGNEVIPIKFICHEAHHMWIEFFSTPWGEYAPVTIMTTPGNYLEGIIDRNGNYTLEPTYEHIKWYKDLQCFGTTGDNRIYFDHKGNRLSK